MQTKPFPKIPNSDPIHDVYFMNDFINAQKMNETYPDRFWSPSQYMLDNIRITDLVKISNGKERFWVEIIKILKNGFYECKVRNKLLDKELYDFGTIIKIHQNNIYDIQYNK